MPKKHQFKVQDLKDWVNSQLNQPADEASDEFKKGLCMALEHVLRQCHWSVEFSYNYWGQQGCIEWQQAGSPEGIPNLKEQFVLGPSGQEYNRRYD